ncbi:MAG: TetR/AcrR family transcriptional regulator [Lachnospiraceae bacterium]|jgi:AcrR family transcriptional regulator|nr:TetR/AcrR family transcriptional regulator [Lachnospiraceae bacterium]MCX4379209.1 TetR/AcrR family transcriptional regulator [Lachnospiraceae bacterium]
MKKSCYHHGNLKQDLILAGLKLIEQDGIAHLSLRKAAAMCGVSHAAPKSHFQNKEEFEEAIRKYITQEFTRYLQEVIDANTNQNEIICDMGRAFVRFFHDYPQSFSLITNQKDIQIQLSEHEIKKSNYTPFQLFVEQAEPVLRAWQVPEEQLVQKILSLWAMVTGLAGIYTMQGFTYYGDWMEMVNKIITKTGY